jgi:hypothetical protein
MAWSLILKRHGTVLGPAGIAGWKALLSMYMVPHTLVQHGASHWSYAQNVTS